MRRMLLTLALITTAGVSYAQTPMPSNEPRDPYGRPLIGRENWVRQPGDQPGSPTGPVCPRPDAASPPLRCYRARTVV